MSQRCSICSGPQDRRIAVDAGISNGQLLRDIASRAGVSQATISRHRARCRPQETRTGELIPASPEEADTIRKRLKVLEKLTDSVLATAASERDSRLLLDAVKRATALLETRAKLQGELEEKLRAIDVDLRTERAWSELIGAATRATAGCPDCRARLAAELRPGRGLRRRRKAAPPSSPGSASPRTEPAL